MSKKKGKTPQPAAKKMTASEAAHEKRESVSR